MLHVPGPIRPPQGMCRWQKKGNYSKGFRLKQSRLVPGQGRKPFPGKKYVFIIALGNKGCLELGQEGKAASVVQSLFFCVPTIFREKEQGCRVWRQAELVMHQGSISGDS